MIRVTLSTTDVLEPTRTAIRGDSDNANRRHDDQRLHGTPPLRTNTPELLV